MGSSGEQLRVHKRRAVDREDSLEISGPAGVKARVKGPTAVVVGAIALCSVGLGYLSYEHDKKTDVIISNQQKLDEHMEEMIYVLSRTDGERASLHLAMPESLARKILR